MEDNHYWRQKNTNGNTGSYKATSSYAYTPPQSSTSGPVKSASISTNQIKEKIGDFLGSSSSRELPLYKDKPRTSSRYNISISKIFRGRRRTWAILAVVMFLVWWFSSLVISWLSVSEVNWTTRRVIVKDAFIISWNNYERYAWGKDEYSPISHRSKFMLNAGAGWIIVDGLDTAMMMNCTRQVTQARQWIKTSLDFSKLDGEMSTFETTIRVLGGLLSAHYLSTNFPHLAPQRDDDKGQKGEDLYIEKAVDLADRLLGAFDTPTGIPYANVNLNTSRGIPSIDGTTSTAEATTLQLELKYISKVTGEPIYWDLAEKVMKAVDAPRSESGLVPIFINPESGKFESQYIRLGSRGDSYYEYLIKQYLQTGENIYKEMWDEALEGIKRHMITWSKAADFTVLAERPSGLSGTWSGKMDHLTCFLPGTIALATTGGLSVSEAKKKMGDAWGAKQEEDLILAEELMKTCWGMYVVTPTGLAPEITHLKIDDPPRRWNFEQGWKQPRSTVDFADFSKNVYKNQKASWRVDYDIQPNDVHNLQRPETVESLYYMWRITGNSVYREWGWRMFRAFSEYSKVIDPSGRVAGYTSLDSVYRIPPKHLEALIAGTNVAHSVAAAGRMDLGRDNMEGFWLSETLKYLYLLFSDDIIDEWNDLSKVVINTEAHFFPRFDIKGHNVFKTGWTRQEKLGHEKKGIA